MKKILVITSSIDATASYVINKAPSDFFRLDVDRFADYKISITKEGWCIENICNYESDAIYTCGSTDSICKKEVRSIYYRKPMLPDLRSHHPQYHAMIQRDIISVINGIVDSFEGSVLSKPSVLRKCENKVYQLLYASAHGFDAPKSYIGNDSAVLHEYEKQQSIIKPISTGKTHGEFGWELYQTNLLTHTDTDISLTPVYLQEYIPKQYEVRMTIVGDCVFPVRIDAMNQVDWRADYEHHKYSLIDCPASIKKRCMQMLKDFQICFGAFDFIVTPANEWIFLEVNPNGQWLWLEQALNIDISGRILDLLKAEE